jgi:hypothetical protein
VPPWAQAAPTMIRTFGMLFNPRCHRRRAAFLLKDSIATTLKGRSDRRRPTLRPACQVNTATGDRLTRDVGHGLTAQEETSMSEGR